jgi:hypothetical protein
MSDPKRSGPDRTIILRLPRAADLSMEIDLAAVRARQSPPEFVKSVLASVLDCAPVPVTPPASRRPATQAAA